MDADQEKVIRFLLEERGNCVVCANPGTGKTTTVLEAAARAPHLQFLVLTYNNSLQTDTIRATTVRGLTNVEVCTYHQLVHLRYDASVVDDWGIVNVLRRRGVRLTPAGLSVREAMRDLTTMAPPSVLSPTLTTTEFDVMVVDEAQDMCRLYFLLVAMVAADSKRPFQLAVMGDVRQSVYSFRGADPRFLRFASDAWRGHPKLLHPERWAAFELNVTHRLSPAMCDFLNEGMEHGGGGDGSGKRLVSSGAGMDYPVVVCADATGACTQFVLRTIRGLRERFSCPYHDIAIMCPSLHADPLAKRVMQELTLNSIPIFVGGGAAGSKDAEERYDQCVRFYTFWSAKGLTVRFAIVLNPNNSYFVRLRRDNDENVDALPAAACPSPHFVTFSRAREMLIAVYAVEDCGRGSGEGQFLPPYLRREWFYGAAATSTTTEEGTPAARVRLVGSRIAWLLEESPMSEDAGATEIVTKLTGTKRGRRSSSSSSVPVRTFTVAQLCSFLNSEFIASELSELYDWFERDSAATATEQQTTADFEFSSVSTSTPVPVAAPAYAPTRFGNLEDVSALNERIMQFFGYDLMVAAARGGVGGGASSPLDEELRKVAPDAAADKRAEELHVRFRKMLADRRRAGAAAAAAEAIDNYVRAVTMLEALRSGMYFRAMHFRDTELNWIPEPAARWVEHVLTRFVLPPSSPSNHAAEIVVQAPIYVRKELHLDASPPPAAEESVLPVALQPKPKTAVAVVHGVVDVLIPSRNGGGGALFVWKYKSTLQLEDFLQLLISCYASPDCRDYYLLNLQTGDRFRLRADCVDRAREAVEALIRDRMKPEVVASGAAEDGNAQFRALYALAE